MPDDDLITTEGVDEAPEPADAPDPAGPQGILPDEPPASPTGPVSDHPGPGQELAEGEG
jgi:hypothetical protein